MKNVWVAADGVVSPLGLTSEENYSNIRTGRSGMQLVDDRKIFPKPVFAGQIQSSEGDLISNTHFESICLKAMKHALRGIKLPGDRTLFILSTTKGNIAFLDEGKPDHPRIHLHATAKYLAESIGLKKYTVVSNACISGVLAVIVAQRFLESGKYDHALIVGADVLSHFIISGFQSLQALSPEQCRPFDVDRKGINLGEAAAAMVLTIKPGELGVKPSIKIIGGGLSNDANHISGPSRTGDELGFAIKQSMREAEVTPEEIDFISAHGTATRYNDEMEAKAFRGVGLDHISLNSLKGYFGHTLGAAGVLETVMSVHSLLNNEVLATKGCEKPEDSPAVNVCRELEPRELTICLKTASGFGGCNAALIFSKQ